MIKLIAALVIGIGIGYGTAFLKTHQHYVHVQDVAHLSCSTGIVQTITFLYGSSSKAPDCETIAKDAVEVSK